MINLLPPGNKRELRAARANTLLLHYNILLLGVVVFMFLATGVVYVYLQTTQVSAQQTIQDNQSKAAGFNQVKSEAELFRSNLSIAKQILDNEVNYTSVILKISRILPAGVVLNNLSLDSATFGTATTLTANAQSYQRAIALKDAFQSSDLFTDVHFQSISTNNDGSDYPVTVNLSVIIKEETAS